MPNQTATPTDETNHDPLQSMQDRLGPRIEAAQEQLAEVNERVKQFIRANPGTCLLGAAALGFLIGRWASRK